MQKERSYYTLCAKYCGFAIKEALRQKITIHARVSKGVINNMERIGEEICKSQCDAFSTWTGGKRISMRLFLYVRTITNSHIYYYLDMGYFTMNAQQYYVLLKNTSMNRFISVILCQCTTTATGFFLLFTLYHINKPPSA